MLTVFLWGDEYLIVHLTWASRKSPWPQESMPQDSGPSDGRQGGGRQGERITRDLWEVVITAAFVNCSVKGPLKCSVALSPLRI